MENKEARRLELIRNLQTEAGTVGEAERWLDELKQLDPLFEGSDEMLNLETAVKARRLAESPAFSGTLDASRSRMLSLINSIVEGENDIEVGAACRALERLVPHPAPMDVIFNTPGDPDPEELLDIMLAYKPIQL